MTAAAEPYPASSLAAPDKRWIGRSFDSAAGKYDGVAQLQCEVADDLLASLPNFKPNKFTVADLGCGTGYCARQLACRFPDYAIVASDLSDQMLRRARLRCPQTEEFRFVRADYQRLPFASNSLDLVTSSLSLQWCESPVRAFSEMRRALVPGGHLAFSTFTTDTLVELRQAWAEVDDYTHVNEFVPVVEIEKALLEAGFSDVDLRLETFAISYLDVRALMMSLKGLGAHNITHGRARHLTGKESMRKMITAYPARSGDGTVSASFNVVLGHVTRT